MNVQVIPMMTVKNYTKLPILHEMLAVCILNLFFLIGICSILSVVSYKFAGIVYVDLACSGPFWHKMESIFATVSMENSAYLKQQVATSIWVLKLHFCLFLWPCEIFIRFFICCGVLTFFFSPFQLDA